MGAERDSEYPFVSTESSSSPPANTATASNLASLLPQGMSILVGGCPDPWSLGISESDPQVDAETYSAGFHRSIILTIDTSPSIPLRVPEIPIASSNIRNEDSPYSPLTCPSETDSDTTCRTTISSYQNPRKFLTTASSRMHRKPNGKRKFPTIQQRYSCNICGLDFAQTQGVTRHQRKAHQRGSLCRICNDFRWSRPYQLTNHLKSQHPDIHLPPALLTEVTKRRRRATLTRSHHIRRQQASPPTTPQPPTPPLPTAFELMHISSPSVSRVAFDPQHKTIVPASKNVTRIYEDARELEVALFDAHVAFLSTEGFSPPLNTVTNAVGIPLCV